MPVWRRVRGCSRKRRRLPVGCGINRVQLCRGQPVQHGSCRRRPVQQWDLRAGKVVSTVPELPDTNVHVSMMAVAGGA